MECGCFSCWRLVLADPRLMGSVANAARRAISDEPDPFVAPFHAKWTELREDEQVYSERAIQHGIDVFRKKYKVNRVGRLSPSMLGRCARESLFTYSGVPQLGESQDSRDLMDVGSWDHMKWQMEGLSFPVGAPYMTDVEKFILDRTMRLGGSLDGILLDGSIFELKTVMFSVMNKIMENGAKWEHLKQVAGYWLLSGIPDASLMYYERGSGSYWEVRIVDIDKNNRAVEETEAEIETLNNHIDADTLPEMLPDCKLGTGKVFRECKYRKVCPKLHSITEAQATAPSPQQEAA